MADEWKKGVDWDFITLVSPPASIQQHMLNALHTSYYKYGTTTAVSEEIIKDRMERCWQRWEETGNSEAIVDLINYEMFLYRIDRDKLCVERARELCEIYKEEDYWGTDSGVKKTITEWLREVLWNEVRV